jgi:hypothetical protein
LLGLSFSWVEWVTSIVHDGLGCISVTEMHIVNHVPSPF